MHEALEQARSASRGEPMNEVPMRRLLRSPAPPGAPQPLVAPPDIRMAYIYEWVDSEGNKHFGGWVAIPLAGFDWVMNDGSTPKMGQSRSTGIDP
jgi:hypothetical protein